MSTRFPVFSTRHHPTPTPCPPTRYQYTHGVLFHYTNTPPTFFVADRSQRVQNAVGPPSGQGCAHLPSVEISRTYWAHTSPPSVCSPLQHLSLNDSHDVSPPQVDAKKETYIDDLREAFEVPPRVLTHSTPTIVDTRHIHTRTLLTRFASVTLSLFAGTDSHSTAHSLSIAATHKGTSSAAPRPTLPFGTTGISSAFGLHLPSVQHHTDTNILQYQLERPASPTHALRRGPSRSLPFPPSIHAGRSCRHGITLRDVCSEHHHQTANVQRERNLLSMGVVSSCPSSFFPGAHCASPFV
jgi:hypothetical protein